MFLNTFTDKIVHIIWKINIFVINKNKYIYIQQQQKLSHNTVNLII